MGVPVVRRARRGLFEQGGGRGARRDARPAHAAARENVVASRNASRATPMSVSRPNIADHLPADLARLFPTAGLPSDPSLARRVTAAIVGRGRGFDDVRGASRETARRLETAFDVPFARVVERRESPTDGFVKYLLELSDGVRVEAVRIPVPCEPPATPEGDAARARVGGRWRGRRRRYVACVSSQAGCALGCAFCATAAGGFVRNLRPSEIVAQVMAVREGADRPVSGVVFMGMGEPLLNADAVLTAARILCDPSVGIAAEDITISTAGIVPGILRLSTLRERFRLSVSLASAFPERRRPLMPVETAHPTGELVDALRQWASATGRRVVIAWVMLGGPDGNCTAEEARALAGLLEGIPVRLDLVDLNGCAGAFVRATEAEVASFRDELCRVLRQPVARRYSGGSDIAAACGMLAGQGGSGRAPSLWRPDATRSRMAAP